MLRRFGVFHAAPRKTGVARNPRTGEPVGIPRGRVVRFRPRTEPPQHFLIPGLAAGRQSSAAQFSRWGLERRSIPAKQPVVEPTRPSSSGGARPAMHPGQTACDETRAAQFSRWGLLPHAPCQPDPHRENWASPASALTRVPPPAVHRAASRRSSLRFSRKTSGIPPSRALSAGRLAALGAHATLPTDCQARPERGVRGGALLGTSPTRGAPKPAGAGRCEFAAVRAAMPV